MNELIPKMEHENNHDKHRGVGLFLWHLGALTGERQAEETDHSC